MHMDYHFAKDLQREINGMTPLVEKKQVKSFEPVTLPKRIKPTASKRKGEKSGGANAKRGRGGACSVVMRPIKSYFTPLPLPQAPANQEG